MHIVAPFNSTHNTSITEEEIEKLKQRMIDVATDAFGIPTKLNSVHAQKWDVGGYANDHSDNTDLEGNDMGWSDNQFATILYLNDNYQGGELVFYDIETGQDGPSVSYVPKTGTLLCFKGDHTSPHEVLPVTSGVRANIAINFRLFDK